MPSSYALTVDKNKDGSINTKELYAALDNVNKTNNNMTTINMVNR